MSFFDEGSEMKAAAFVRDIAYLMCINCESVRHPRTPMVSHRTLRWLDGRNASCGTAITFCYIYDAGRGWLRVGWSFYQIPTSAHFIAPHSLESDDWKWPMQHGYKPFVPNAEGLFKTMHEILAPTIKFLNSSHIICKNCLSKYSSMSTHGNVDY